jgi:hypothetical protein
MVYYIPAAQSDSILSAFLLLLLLLIITSNLNTKNAYGKLSFKSGLSGVKLNWVLVMEDRDPLIDALI